MLNGVDSRSPLGTIVSIRAEDDAETIKNFTPEQRRIRNEWRRKRAKFIPKQEVNRAVFALKDAFFAMAGEPASQ